MGFNIAIDGPAGAGKSTIARCIAEELSFIYVDTGAMYRAMAYYFLKHQVAEEDFAVACRQADITIRHEGGQQVVYLNGENVNGVIRTEEVGNMASLCSPVPAVREKLLKLQHELARSADVVMDGRDIGTCVLPDAQLKIYLTAGSRARAERRYKELAAKGESCSIEQIEADIIERDHRDMTREISPLVQAEDAVLIDSSDLTIRQVVDRVKQLCRERGVVI